jgi:uncharacterized protein (TIGR02147 family)
MKVLFESSSYKGFLSSLIYGEGSPRGLQVKYAKAMGCQAAYLSQVLKGKAELSEDHAVRLAGYLGLAPIAFEYFLLLVRLARASTPELKAYLETLRQRLIQDNEETQSRIKSERPEIPEAALQKYFSSWIPSTIHMATSSDAFQTIQALALRLRLSPAKVTQTLLLLEELGAVTQNGKIWKYSGGPIHFARKMPVNVQHQVSRRNQAIRSIEDENPEDVHFSSIFTISRATFKGLKAELLDYIERSHQEIHRSESEELYEMCLDLFCVV